ncbi:MAG: leucine-rich repeat domain-containing protein [Bacteroidales bacterium]|nr:leucine-rich repeat domain-containing protein [Clostridium sp.]MCM1204801.1 leucine-rich repeat domain-containing protein [Bacteroidales bacterium]
MEGVTRIGGNAFEECTKLKNVNVKTTKLKKVGRQAFSDLGKNNVIFKIAGNRKQKNATIKLLKKKSVGYKKKTWKFE